MAGGMSRMAKAGVAGINTRPLPGVFQEGQGPDSRRVHRRDRPSPEARHSPAGTIRCEDADQMSGVKGRRIYDEAVREAVILVWEASDRICGKRLKAALPHLVESMERHGHLDLDRRSQGAAAVRQRGHPGPAAETGPRLRWPAGANAAVI